MYNPFKAGDRIAERSNSFLSKGIRFFMKLYKPSVPDFSHIACIISVWGELWVAEALEWGFRIWPLTESGYLTEKQVVIIRDKRGFTQDMIDRMSKKMVSMGGVRYQYENLPQWMAKIILKINIFKKTNEKALYCSEAGAIFENVAYPDTFPAPNETSPSDHFIIGDPEIIDFNHIL